jgi:hypothetical protein
VVGGVFNADVDQVHRDEDGGGGGDGRRQPRRTVAGAAGQRGDPREESEQQQPTEQPEGVGDVVGCGQGRGREQQNPGRDSAGSGEPDGGVGVSA